MVEKSVIRIIERFVNTLRKQKINVDKAVLYGSFSRGTQRKDSDIDVAIVSKDFGRDSVEEGMRLFRIAGDIDPRIGPVAISLESYEKDTWIPLIYEIRKKGIELASSAK